MVTFCDYKGTSLVNAHFQCCVSCCDQIQPEVGGWGKEWDVVESKPIKGALWNFIVSKQKLFT